MRRAVPIAVALSCLAAGALAQSGETAFPDLLAPVDGGTEALDIRVEFDPEREGSLRWSDEISRFGTNYIRLHLRSAGAPFPEGARFVILPDGGQQMDVDLSGIGEDGVWSPMIIGGRARIAVISEELPLDAVLLIDQIALETAGITLYSAHGRNDIRPVHDKNSPPVVAALAPSVALLSFIEGGRSVSCTGFLVAPDVIMTNEHCVSSDAACASLTAVFGYEADANGRLGQGPQASCMAFDPTWSNPGWDVTAFRIAPPPGDDFPPLQIAAPTTEPPSGELVVIQHPGAVPKHVSFIECSFDTWPVDGREPGSDFSHTCDTAKGSSGAPVFDLDGNLVGVHHFGFQDAPNDFWTENRAVRIAPIAEWLAETGIP